MSDGFVTIMIVPERTGAAKRYRVHRRYLYMALIGVLSVASVVLSLVVGYSYMVGETFKARRLATENAALKGRLETVKGEVESMQARLAEVRRLDTQLRSLTQLVDVARSIELSPEQARDAVGGADPLMSDPLAAMPPKASAAHKVMKAALFDSRMINMEAEAERQVRSLTNIIEFFEKRDSLLSGTPSLSPVPGAWITSKFGHRSDPYSGVRTMHAGIDFAAREGTPIYAPARGLVIFSGQRGAYGQMIAIEHPDGRVTHYGHMSKRLVRVGDKVSRNQHIGNVGNTGRSTGPHLHYEVRENGIPVDPSAFVLDSLKYVGRQ